MRSFSPDPARGAAVYAADRAHVFHSWSAQRALKPIAVAGAQGCHVWDFDGNRYLDFSSQLVNTNIGHQHPKVVAAIAEQAGKLTTIAPQHANEARGQAAQRLIALAPDGDADPMARTQHRREKVAHLFPLIPRNTRAAITSTGDPRRWPNEYA